MQVSQPNNVKIYNLSAGKSLPEWLSERKRRTLQKNDIDIRRRIELIQDFEMPTASTNVLVSSDRQYVMATGVYKPRVRCYDTSQLSLKFERCLDSDVVKFCVLSDDYSKMVFLHSDRYIEFHAQYGRYYRTRIPKFGRDMSYHYPSCDLYVVGAGSEVYRLNLEQGKFLNPLQTDAVGINVCDLNPVHQLFAAGTSEGRVECWDPRSRTRVGVLDVGLGLGEINQDKIDEVPAVTALKFRDGLTMGVGTSTGHVLLYDMRANRPVLTKDHQYGLPINSIAFQDQLDMVLSTDSKILKIWDRETGKPFTSVEPQTNINDLCLFPESGLLFMATESPKMLVYYIPSLGPAPRWCSFLDNLTEELEEDDQPTVYDDYKFVTKEELASLGLTHLMGTNLLRAYMHGYFVDMRLYQKAKTIAEPFAYEEYRKKRIQEKIEEERANRVRLKKLPKINRSLAEKLLDDNDDKKAKDESTDIANPLGDDRFAALFKNPDFQVDEDSLEFRLLHPVLSKHEKGKQKRRKQAKQAKEINLSQFDEVEELEGKASDGESSSDDEHTWREEQRNQMKTNKKDKKDKQGGAKKLKFYELKKDEGFRGVHKQKSGAAAANQNRASLGDRARSASGNSGIIRQTGSSFGEMEMTYSLKKSKEETQQQLEYKAHREERKKLRRSAGNLMAGEKKGPVYWRGKRVR